MESTVPRTTSPSFICLMLFSKSSAKLCALAVLARSVMSDLSFSFRGRRLGGRDFRVFAPGWAGSQGLGCDARERLACDPEEAFERVDVVCIETSRELTQATHGLLQRTGDGLAVRRQNLTPQLCVAARNAREVSEAGTGELAGTHRRPLERPGKSERQNVGQVARPRHLCVVLRRVAQHDPG